MQRIGSMGTAVLIRDSRGMGWGLGDGTCTSVGLNYACRKAQCARRTAQCQSRNDINTAAPVQRPLTLTHVCGCVHML